jgi:TonB family protein
MAGKDKKIRTALSGFLRYIGKEMPNSEKNAFERELQKDLFAAEAAEGFDILTPSEVENDLSALQRKLKSRTSGRTRLLYYSIAASVAVLMVISSVFIIIQRNKPGKLISENAKTVSQSEISELTAVSEPKIKEKQIAFNETKPTVQQRKKSEPVAAGEIETKNTHIIEEQQVGAAGNRANDLSVLPVKKEVEIVTARSEDLKKLSAEAFVPAAAPGTVTVKGKVISSEDNLPIPGVNVFVKGTTLGTVTDTGGYFKITLPDASTRSLVANFIGMESKEFTASGDSTISLSLNPSELAMNEVVVVGYGTQKSTRRDMTGAVSTVKLEEVNRTTGYSPPLPSKGKESFDKYIEENIQRPPDAQPGKREIVVISFTVKSTGLIENIKIIRSPGKSFSDEAIRLLKEGPDWKPAEENNLKIDNEVRIRVVFKQD